MPDLSALHFGRESHKVKGTQQFVNDKVEKTIQILACPFGQTFDFALFSPSVLFAERSEQHNKVRIANVSVGFHFGLGYAFILFQTYSVPVVPCR